MKLHGRNRKDCPHCGLPRQAEEIKCSFCGSVLIDTALEMDDAEIEELEDELRHNHDGE